MTVSRLVGGSQPSAFVETTNVPGATTSGLNRPDLPSTLRPTLPRLEKGAISLLVCVSPSQGWLVMLPTTTSLVMTRMFSMAPTVMTFFAVPGASIPPPPELPPANTASSGWEPSTAGKASRTAASQLAEAMM